MGIVSEQQLPTFLKMYLNKEASIMVLKTMVLSLIEYGDIIYAGTSIANLDKLDKLFYRGLRICDGTNTMVSRYILCNDCNIDSLNIQRNVHILLFMHKQTLNNTILKKSNVRTRLHQAPVFKTYKSNYEKAIRLKMFANEQCNYTEVGALAYTCFTLIIDIGSNR